MNQEQNNLNLNNFNTQGNNGILNNQSLQNNQSASVNQSTINPHPQSTPNYQQPINQMNMQEPTPQPMNSFESGNNSNKSFNRKTPKKMNLGLIVGIVAAVVTVIIVIVIIFTLSKNTNNNETNTNNDNNGSNTANTKKCEYNDIELTNLKGTTLDYYYNVDTSKFDSGLFNGDINFFGYTIDGKITTNKLKEKGILVDKRADNLSFKTYGEDCNGEGCHIEYFPDFSIDTTTNGLNSDVNLDNMSDGIILIDYTGGNNLYSDNTLVSLGGFGWNLTGRNIYPTQLKINDYSEITIDLILERLGNPTYVYGRTNSCIDSQYSYTTYIYVYNEVAFLYSFYNWQNLSLASVYYYPIDELLLKPDDENYNTYLEQLDAQYGEYKNNK